jgi:hypothetical protein
VYSTLSSPVLEEAFLVLSTPIFSEQSLSLMSRHQNLVSTCPHTCYMPAHLILFDLITQIKFGEAYRSLSSSLSNLLYSPLTSSLLGPNIFLSTLFANILRLGPCLYVEDQVSHPYKTEDKITVVYTLIFTFHTANCRTKEHEQNISRQVLNSV